MEGLPIQGYDLLMLVILVLAGVFGAWKGLAWQVASIASLVISCIVAVRFSAQVAPYIYGQAPWNRFLAMLILFLITSLAVWLLFRFVAGFIDRLKLKEFDRQMGALFGVAKGVLFCLVITFFAVTLAEGSRQAVLNSHSGKFTAKLLQKATPVMPQEVRDVLGKYIDEFERKLDPNTLPSQPLEELPKLGRNPAATLGQPGSSV
jgi:membrane protein required for colicin V production